LPPSRRSPQGQRHDQVAFLNDLWPGVRRWYPRLPFLALCTPETDDRTFAAPPRPLTLAEAELVELAAGLRRGGAGHRAGDLGARWLGLALDVAFWVSLAAVAAAALTIVVMPGAAITGRCSWHRRWPCSSS